MAYHRPKTLSWALLFVAGLSGCATGPVEPIAVQTSPPLLAGSSEPERFLAFGVVDGPVKPRAVDPPAPATEGVSPEEPAGPALQEPPRRAMRGSSAPSRAFPALPVEAIQDTLPIPRLIDLTTPPDDLWIRIRNGFAMPNLTSPLVLDRQIWYAGRPNDIKRMVERSRRYLYHIVSELEKRGMPTELALLPMVESAFNPMAYSRAHASGLWQFIPSTGKTYKLQQNWWYDARRDIIASTNAALDYLQFLYDMHGDWHLALASYNWGENAVARAIERNRAKGLATDYLSLTMPQETRYYVPKLQALKNIIAHPEGFDISLDAIPNEPYFVTVTIKNMDIQLAAKLAEMPIEELIALNPAHKRPIISQETLVLPADRAETFQANLQSHDQPLVTWRTYTFRKGDRLDKLAAKHGIALAKLKQANGITAKTRVVAGFPLLVPVKGLGAAAAPLPVVFKPPSAPTEASRTVTRRFTHTVSKGETLTAIADRYDVSIRDLRRWNKIGRLLAGQKLVVERQVTIPATRSRTPRRGKQAVRPASKQRLKAAPSRRVQG